MQWTGNRKGKRGNLKLNVQEEGEESRTGGKNWETAIGAAKPGLLISSVSK